MYNYFDVIYHTKHVKYLIRILTVMLNLVLFYNLLKVLIDITLKYILVYHKFSSVHSAVTLTIFKGNRSNYEITYKDVLKSY